MEENVLTPVAEHSFIHSFLKFIVLCLFLLYHHTAYCGSTYGLDMVVTATATVQLKAVKE